MQNVDKNKTKENTEKIIKDELMSVQNAEGSGLSNTHDSGTY